MGNREMRFKSQALQNLPLTGIKASNLINSVARRGRWRLDAIFWPQVQKEEAEEKEEEDDDGDDDEEKGKTRGKRLTVSLNWLAVTIRNINAVCSAFFKRVPFALNCSCILCEHTVPRPLASTAIMDLALVITHFTISDVTSKQQQPCH